jgi:putative ABC transport system permease protein
MRGKDALLLAARALGAHRRRTLLSLLGVSIGIAAVLVMTALGAGARRYVADQFRTIGADVVAIVPGRVETTGAIPGVGSAPNDLTVADARALVRGVECVARGTPLLVGNESLAHDGRRRDVLVLGTTSEMLGLRGMRVATGEFLPEGSWERGSSVVVLGSKLPVELFPGEDPLGQTVRLGDWRLRVIGTLAPRGTHLGVDLDECVLVPVVTAQAMFDTRMLFRVMLELRPGVEARAALDPIRTVLRGRHGGEEDFTLITQDAVLDSLGSILDMLTLALVAIASISLLVAGVGIANVMLVAVSERTREVGLCKALGATRADVLAQFLIEAALLCLAGGLVGVALGWTGTAALSSAFPALAATPPPWSVAASLGVSFATGLLAGTLPARRAMRMEAVAALSGRSA